MPKFIYLVQSSAELESGPPPTQAMFETMNAYTTALSDADMLLAFDGLKPSSTGAAARITFPSSPGDAEPAVQNGPFAPGGGNGFGLVAGFWIVQARDFHEAVAWAKKAPFSKLGGGAIEVRQIAGDDDKEPGLTPELREQGRMLTKMAEERARARIVQGE